MKSELAIELSKLRDFEDPRISLEQYMTPAELAADIIHSAYMNGDIKNREVLDLGTGTGILGVGAALAGARRVVGVDTDAEALKIAKENIESAGAEKVMELVESEMDEFSGDFNTVVMNPPFSVHSDIGIDFMKKAVESADAVYTVSHPGARRQIENFIHSSDHELVTVQDYTISLPSTYGFHTEESRETDIEVIVTRRTG